MLKFFSPLLLLFLVNCEKQTTFIDAKLLNGEPLKEVSVLSGGNVSLVVVDTFLVIQKNEEKFISIYSTKNHELLASLGKEGRGPKEFLGPELIKQIGYDEVNNSPLVYVYDYKRKNISTINVIEAIEEGEITLQEPLPSQSNYLPYFFYKGEDFYLASPASGAGRFLIYDYDTSEITITPYIPKLDVAIPKTELSSVYRSTAYVSTEKKLIASATLHIGQLDFFDLDGNYIRSTVFDPLGSSAEELKLPSSSWKETRYYIEEIESKNNKIYALNFNNKVLNFNNENRPNNVKIQVFDWLGKPLKEYELNDRLINAFAVDPIHNRIYAYSPNEEKYNIIIYSID
ncbi:MAG: BF3164 family lipoprotein [Balneola sp.]